MAAAISSTAQAQQTSRVVRPLKVLVPLIRNDLAQGNEAAQRAGMPYYRAAGEKLIEAKAQLEHGQFGRWVKRNFDISDRQARTYMAYAHVQNGGALPFSSLRDFLRQTSKPRIPQSDEYKGFSEAEAKQNAEVNARQGLTKKIIETGYRLLAAKFHPDKGGSAEAMARLNNAREWARRELGLW
jgi:hypothetical protein